jgi:hypothetical protein
MVVVWLLQRSEQDLEPRMELAGLVHSLGAQCYPLSRFLQCTRLS